MLIPIIQIFAALILSATILLQAKGTGLGLTFGGSGGEYRSKRGLERILFFGTIILSAVFLGLSLLGVVLE